MASKRAQRRRSCEGKIRHDTFEAAVAHAHSLRHKTGDRSYCAYPQGSRNGCEFCGGWHVGRRPYRLTAAFHRNKQ